MNNCLNYIINVVMNSKKKKENIWSQNLNQKQNQTIFTFWYDVLFIKSVQIYILKKVNPDADNTLKKEQIS